jgi:hypothetical protein
MTIRKAPERTIQKWQAWRKWHSFWNWTFLSVGGIQAGLAVLVAVNSKDKPVFGQPWNWIIAVAAALFAFLVTGLGAQAKAAAFETAGRELEKCIAAYEMGDAVDETELGKAEQRGIDILNRMKPN